MLRLLSQRYVRLFLGLEDFQRFSPGPFKQL